MSKFKVGDRVRVLTKQFGCDRQVGSEVTIYKISDGLFYVKEDSGFEHTGCGRTQSELGLTNSKGATIVSERRTFKLLKNSPTLRKGALWQEQCDDGTQPYELITPEFKISETNTRKSTQSDRSIIEEQPDWFVEVFKVHPEYMTKEELEKWEAFKKGSKVAKVAKAKKSTGKVEHHVVTTTVHEAARLAKQGFTVKQISRKLKIKTTTAATYLWTARKNGLL